MSDDQWGIKRFLRGAAFYVLAFLVGGLVAFGYTYVPLHNAKNWKIDYLEQRLAETKQHLDGMETKVAAAEASSAPAEQAVEALKAKVDGNDEALDALKQKLAKAEKDVRDHRRSRDQWKARYNEAEAARSALAEQAEALQEKIAATEAPEPAARIPSQFGSEPGGASDDAAAAASPAPVAAPARTSSHTAGPSEVDVPVGARWSSDDGRAQFDLLAIEGGEAKIVRDPIWLGPGQKPSVIGVAVGSEFEVGATVGQTHLVVLKRINGTTSITIQPR